MNVEADARRMQVSCLRQVPDYDLLTRGQRIVMSSDMGSIILEVQNGQRKFGENGLVFVVISSSDPRFPIQDPLRPFVFSVRQLYCRAELPNVHPVLRSYLEHYFH